MKDRATFHVHSEAAVKREEFINGLCKDATGRVLTKEENFIILQGTLAGMLAEVIPGLLKEARQVNEGPGRTNALAFVEIATELRKEMLAVVDAAIEGQSPLITLSSTIEKVRLM